MRRPTLATFSMATLGTAAFLGVANGWLSSVRSDAPADVRIVAAWPAGLFEARVAFDRPVDAAVSKAVVGRSITFDEVNRTLRSKPTANLDRWASLRVAAAKLVDDGRTLVLSTDPHPGAGTYALAIPGVKPTGRAGPGATVVARYDLTGVEARWESNGPAWSGWLPSSDPQEGLGFAAGSAEHSRLAGLLKTRGKLTLAANVTLPKGRVVVRVTSDAPLKASLSGEPAPADEGEEFSKKPAVFRVESTGEPTPLDVTIVTGEAATKTLPTLRATFQTGGEGAPEFRLAGDDFMVPWTPPTPPSPGPLANVPKLTGGDPLRGAAVFKSAESKCANCHKIRGEGGAVGPDLTNLRGQGLTDIYRDIFEPSVRIHPDYVAYTVVLKDGRVLVGTVRTEGADALRVTDTEAKSTVVSRSDIEDIRASATSIMPVGLVGVIGEDKLRDLLAYLTSAAPQARSK